MDLPFVTRERAARNQCCGAFPPGLEPPAPVPPASNVPALGSVGSAKHSTGDARFRVQSDINTTELCNK